MFRLTAIVVLVTLPAIAWSQDEGAAVADILSAGGSVVRDDKLPGKPVVRVELTACRISPASFEKLRFLTHLQYLDL